MRSARSWNNVSSDINMHDGIWYQRLSRLGVHEDHPEIGLRCRLPTSDPKSLGWGPGIRTFHEHPPPWWLRGPLTEKRWWNNLITSSSTEKQQQSPEVTVNPSFKAGLSFLPKHPPMPNNFSMFEKYSWSASCHYHHSLGGPRRINHLKRKNNVKIKAWI